MVAAAYLYRNQAFSSAARKFPKSVMERSACVSVLPDAPHSIIMEPGRKC